MLKFEIWSSILKRSSILLVSGVVSYSSAFGGGSVGVAGFILPDGTVMQAQEIETYDFITALANINSGYTYEIDQTETPILLDRITFRNGIPLIEGVNEKNENVIMIETSIIQNNFSRDDSNDEIWYMSKPNTAGNANNSSWLNQLEVNEDVFAELTYISKFNHMQSISNPYLDDIIKTKNCFLPTTGDEFIETSTNNFKTMIYSSRNRKLFNMSNSSNVKKFEINNPLRDPIVDEESFGSEYVFRPILENINTEYFCE